jgi:hypothetical protein
VSRLLEALVARERRGRLRKLQEALTTTLPFGNHPTLSNDLVSYWPMDETSGTRYDIHGSNHLTENNTVIVSPRGPSGTVAHFTKANGEALTLAGGWTDGAKTVNVWFSLDNVGADDWTTVFSDRNGGGQIAIYSIAGKPAFVSAGCQDAGNGFPSANSAWGETYLSQIPGAWAMLTAVWTASEVRLYVNGVQRFTAVSNGLPAPDGNYHAAFGAAAVYGGVSGAQLWHGDLAHGSVWSGDIGSGRIAALYEAGVHVTYADIADKSGLISYYAMNEASGTRYDSHVSNHLTDLNTVTSVTAALGAKSNAAASFVTANTEYLEKAGWDWTPYYTTGWTLAFWVYKPYDTTEFALSRDNITLREWVLYYAIGVGYRLAFMAGGGEPEVPATPGAWNHVVISFDPADSKGRISINGGSTSASTPVTPVPGATPFQVGGRVASGQLATVRYDEMGLWSRVLSAQERTDLSAGLFY